MRRKPAKKIQSSSSESEDGPAIKKPSKIPKPADESSSESDIENYLQPIDQIDLNSSFFSIQTDIPEPTDQVEDDVFESDEETETVETPSTSKSHFQQLQDYTKKMEEAKKYVEEYKLRKQKEEKQTDVSHLLAAGETKLYEDEAINLHSSDFESCSDSEKETWEEVGEARSIIPEENFEVTVEMPGIIKKKKREDIVAVIKRRMNRIKKLNQLLIHKVHLLCWIAHGNFVNTAINSKTVLAAALSLMPPEPPRPVDLQYIEQVVKWYKNVMRNAKKAMPKNKTLEEILEVQIAKKETYNRMMFVYIFIAVLRSLSVPCRLVLSLQVEPVRPPDSELLSLSTKNNKVNCNISQLKVGKNINKKEQKAEATKTKAKQESTEIRKTRLKTAAETKKTVFSEQKKTRSKNAAETKRKESTQVKSEEIRKTRSQSATETKENEAPRLKVEETRNTRSKSATDAKDKVERTKKPRLKSTIEKKKKESPKSQTSSNLITAYLKKTKVRRTHIATSDSKKSPTARKSKPSPKSTRRLKSQTSPKIAQLDGPFDDSSDDEVSSHDLNKAITTSKPKLRTLPRRLAKKFEEYKDTDSEDDTTVRSLFSPKNTGTLLTKRSFQNTTKDLVDTVRKRKSNEDTDYIPKTKKKSEDFPPLEKVKAKKRSKINEKAIHGVDFWVEIFSESQKRWISVNVIEGQVDCVDELYARATPPVTYVLAWNNNNTVKDVTSRYCKNFNTTTRMLRIDPKWWTATLKLFTGPKTFRDKDEDEELERKQLKTPLPKTIKEYKNHPLYVLKRHLLKYEAIYPPDTPTVGFVRKEPVYPRQCVYILHPRDIWLKKAKVVKLGEKPYKIVKGRPRWDKLSHKIVTDPEMDIFGPWQVEDYEPPTAENGVVPRNAYGNVELFKPCMLPKKTVHLRLPGLRKTARRMNIDCASAFTGFDYSRGFVHPAYDGYVVCEEYADILVAAWELEQDELEQKEQEKIDKRVYGNWRRLIKGLLIRERLKAKYDFGDISRGGDNKKAKKGPRFSIKKRK